MTKTEAAVVTAAMARYREAILPKGEAGYHEAIAAKYGRKSKAMKMIIACARYIKATKKGKKK